MAAFKKKRSRQHVEENDEEDSSEPGLNAFGALMTLLQKPDSTAKAKRPSIKKASADNLEGPVDDQENQSDEEDEGEIGIDLDENEDLADPFEFHFAAPDLQHDFSKSSSKVSIPVLNGERSIFTAYEPSIGHHPFNSFKSLKLKYRLEAPFKNRKNGDAELTDVQRKLADYLFNYQDILYPCQKLEDHDSLVEVQDLYLLHSLNHIFKTRDRVIKNNAKLLAHPDQEHRDQGFTRPKVLILVPSKNFCNDLINRMCEISGANQVENKKRFNDAFFEPGEPPESKPKDFLETFKGNTSDMFCMGVKFTRQAVKLYSSFYTSDLIVASPLGLRLIIEKGDYDFLSSIEIAIVDHADLMQMQTWENVDKIFRHMNKVPKESHGCDFSRVRPWYLDDQAAKLRQTVVLSQYTTPEMNALLSSCQNLAGSIKIRPVFGENECAISTVGSRVPQMFSRINSQSPVADPDVRFKHFTSAILPAIMRSASQKGTLIFVSSYLDFVRLRNYMDENNYSYAGISEYSSQSETSRARSYFASERISFLIYTERLHHFRRYSLKGVKQVVMYSLPDNPTFYREVLRFLVRSSVEQNVSIDLFRARVLYSKWDTQKLERIVGTAKIGQLIQGVNDIFEFY